MFIVRDKPPTFEDVAGHVLQSVIAIAVGKTVDEKPNIVGTGFALLSAEYFATCWHVAATQEEMAKLGQDDLARQELVDATLRVGVRAGENYIWREVEPKTWFRVGSTEQDVCVYRIVGIGIPPLQLQASDRWLLGSEVGVIGFPLGRYLQGERIRPFVYRTFIAGGFERKITPESVVPSLALGTSLAGGFRGGPVFSAKDGEVLGMVSSKVLEPDTEGRAWPAGISLAIVPSIIKNVFLQSGQISTAVIKEALRKHLP